jgi:hypothetical protein
MIKTFIRTLAEKMISFPSNRLTDRFAVALIRYSTRKNPQPIRTRFGYYINVGGDPDPAISSIRSTVFLGKYEASFMCLLASMVKSNETVIDIGANEGYMTLSSHEDWEWWTFVRN